MLLFPAVATAFDGRGRDFHGVVWWVTFTPFHILWAGSEAVAVFFVLSGFVLTRAAAGTSFSWRAYYPSRLLRLYLPVAGALVFALVTILVFPRKVVLTGHGGLINRSMCRRRLGTSSTVWSSSKAPS